MAKPIKDWVKVLNFFPGLVLLASLFLTTCAFAQANIRISHGTLGVTQIIFPLGLRAGVFKRNGLNAEVVYMAGRGTVALISGDVQFTFGGGASPIATRLGGADIVILGGLNQATEILVSAPSINKPEDLIGRKVGIFRFGQTSDYVTGLILKRLDLVPGKDVTLVQIGDTPTRLRALISGSIQAATLSLGEETSAKKHGLKILFDGRDIPFPSSMILTTESYIKLRRDVVKRFVKSVVDIIQFVKTKPEETKKLLQLIYRENDRDVLEDRYKGLSTIYPDYPYITGESIEAVLSIFRDQGRLKKSVSPESFLDMSFLREIEEGRKQ